MWPDSSEVRVLGRSTRGPGFESRSGRVLFLPCDIWWPVLGKAGENCHRSTVWLGSPVVRVLARHARGPEFESRSGHVLFPPL